MPLELRSPASPKKSSSDSLALQNQNISENANYDPSAQAEKSNRLSERSSSQPRPRKRRLEADAELLTPFLGSSKRHRKPPQRYVTESGEEVPEPPLTPEDQTLEDEVPPAVSLKRSISLTRKRTHDDFVNDFDPSSEAIRTPDAHLKKMPRIEGAHTRALRKTLLETGEVQPLTTPPLPPARNRRRHSPNVKSSVDLNHLDSHRSLELDELGLEDSLIMHTDDMHLHAPVYVSAQPEHLHGDNLVGGPLAELGWEDQSWAPSYYSEPAPSHDFDMAMDIEVFSLIK